MAKNLFLQSPSAEDLDEIYKEGAESISRLSLPSFPGDQQNPPAPQAGSRPAPTRDDIIRRATELGIDPAVPLAIWGIESGSNFNSRDSYKGAVGGMQVMPDTYRQMMGTTDGQRDPWNNMEAGLRYIAYGQKVLGTNDPALLAAGYHAGYHRPELKRGEIPGTHDGLMSTRDYAASVARKVGKGGVTTTQAVADPAALQAQLDKEEPGRYRVLSEDEARRFELQALLDAEEPGRFKVLSDEELAQFQGDTPQAEAPDAAAIPGATPIGTTPEEVGFWDRIPQVAKSGWQNMTRALDVSRAVLSDDFSPQTVDLLASTIEQQIKEAQDDKGRQHESERALKDAIEQFGKTEGAWDTTTGLFSLLGTVFANPKGVAIGTVEQLANMLPSMGGAAAGAAAGAGVGAAAGSVVPGAGTAAGAGIGALWGSRAGLAAGTAALEFGHEITEAITSRLQDQGKAPTRDNIAALLADPAMQSEIKTQAAKKGLTLAAVDALTMGIAGKIGSKGVEAAKAGNRGQAMRYGAGAIGIEAAGEPVGEAASQLVARGEIDKADVAAEAIYGVPASVGGAAIGTAMQTMRDRSGASAPATPPAAWPVDAATPVPAGAAPSGTTPQQTVEPTATPQPAPAPETAAPSGPITRAMERAVGSAPEDEPSPAGEAPPADLPRVRITAENGESMTGVADMLAEDGSARVIGDDGQVYVIGPNDGVTIEPVEDEAPVAPGVAAPVTETGIPVSEQDQALTEPEPVAPTVSEAPQEAAQAPAERPLTEWPEDELRAQLRAVTQQAKLQGMTDELRALRRTISAEIDRRNQERENERRSAADPVPVPDDRVAGGQLPAQIGADFPAGTPDAQAVPGRGAAGRTEVDGAASGKAVSGAGDAADQQPALSPGLIVRTDGTPFKSEAAARQAMRNRRLAGYRPVQVDGGWALEEVPQHEKPLAGDGLTSYRYRGPYGYVMIGARDHQDALNEARRSLTEGDATIDNLQVWDGNQYVDVTGPGSGDARSKAERAKPPRAAQRASEPREMTEDGRAKDGGPIMPGDTFRTLSGRVTTPYPKQKSERYASQWLIDNAVEEAESRGDDFNASAFRAASMLRGGALADADRESMLMYLFGEQPPVVPSILKPLSAKRGAEERTQKGEESTKQQVARTEQEAPQDEQPATQTQAESAPASDDNVGTKPKQEKAKHQVSKNTIFTDEAAEKARAILRAKLNQLNSGIDPEVMQAGITLAGYHIERGARTFAAYAKAMIEDMGEAVRPYLKSWYLGAKFDPRTAGMEGLSTAAEVEAFDLDNLDAAADTQAEAEAEPEADTEVVVTPAGREIEVRYKVVEGDSLIPSNLDDGRVNPDYPQELQPRNRGKAASELQITNIAANMNPRLLGESASTTDGAPIVSPEGVVESGNGRTMAIMRAYRRGMGSAKSYRDWLAAQGYDVAGMRAPVLVRERVTPMSQQELIEYTRESNARTTMQMSPEEQARTDADLVPGIIDLYVGGDIANAANRDFVRAFIDDIVPQSEQGDMVTDGGALSIRGRKRIEAALMHAAYGDERLVADLFVDPSAEIKTIGGAMLDAAAQWVKMRRNADPSLDVTPQLVAAVNIVRRAREEDKSVYDVANQIDVFSGATDPVTMDFLSMFFRGERYNRQRSREVIGDMLNGYADTAEKIVPGPDMFGAEPPSAQEILRSIYEKRQREESTGQQGDIFATRTPSDDGGVAGGGRAGQGPGAQAQDAAPQESGGPVNVPSTRESVERDSGDGGAAQSVVSGPDGNAAGQDAGRPRRTGEGSGQTGRAGLGDQRVPGARPASGRARGDQPVHKPDGEFRPESRPAGDFEPAGSGRDSSQGSAVERERQDAVEADAHAPGADDLAQRLAAQRKAKNTPTKWGNKASIDAALPLLLPEQREDVLKAENRLADHNGILFTNATGTGKTATSLGIAKRFINDGKDNIIVVVPSDKIAADWVKFGRMLGVPLKQLEDTKSNGDTGPVITTYANFGQNETLALRDWDLVIADESHYLSSNENGDATDALNQLRALTGHHKGFDHWVRQRFPKEWGAYRDAMKARSDANGNLDIGPDRYAMLEAAEVRAREKWAPIETREREKWENRWAKQEGLPKTVFLSATPFAYAKNTDYAEGYLFHYVEPAQLKNERGSRGYNQGSPRDRFLMQHFGYRMRYNKLTAPEAGVNSELMEQQFNEWLKSQGALSGRRLEVPFDYDRKFVLVDDAVGTKIDEALKFLREAEDGRYREIYDAVMQQFDYQRRMYLLESMKARAAVPIIREHMAAGRKVVVFHDFNKGGGFDPFRDAIHVIADEKTRILAREVLSRPMFRIDFSGLNSPIETMRAAFPDALFFNGTVPKKQRRQNADLFNDDNSGRNLIVVQSDAGREGVSLHDTTGKHQRVEINLGMPVKPVAATQIEGRIYRTGQASNAIFRYLTTGTAWEASAFASKIAERASTAENLALGSEARGLKEAFIDAYLNAGEFPVSRDDGKGGKENDRKLSAALTASPFERAKTFYYAQAKNTRRRDQREGIDYFATPEPVGFKMVEWADIRPNDKVLEPSAGHGAIARFFPQLADVTMVEPSYELSQRAGLANGNARIVNDTFESLHINNKYDAIVMNPPYGVGGKTAVEHLAKAAKHLRNGGRIVALLPRGGMADKRLNDFLESEDAENLYRVASVDLPPSTFERAGTSVNTRIVILERHDNPEDAEAIRDIWIDLSGAGSINELFDRIEDVSMPGRTAPATPEQRQDLVEHITAKGKRLLGVIRTDLTQEEAKAIDPYTFRKKNAEGQTGWFIRSKHLDAAPKFSIAPPTQSEAFKRWFGDSKVVDAEGNPLVVYHGTGADISTFDPSKTKLADGVFVTPSASYASTFAEASEGGPNVIPLYAKIERPRYIKAEDFNTESFLSATQDGNADGVIVLEEDGKTIHSAFVFEPTQLKSSIGNIGTYDPANPDIRYSLATDVDRNQQIPVASAPFFDVEPQSLFSAAREWYRDNLLGTSVENASLGAPVHFSHRGQSKALSIGRRNPIRMSIVQALPDLVRNAVVVEEAAGRKGRDFIYGYATLVAPVEIDGNTYAVSMKVRRAHGREIFYTLQGFNIEGASDGGGWQLTPTGDSHSTAALQNDGDAAAVSMPGAAAAPSPDINVAASRASAPRNLQESHSTASQSEAGSSGVRPDSRPGDPLARRRTLTVGELLDAMNDGNRAFSVDASPVYDGILWNDEDNGNIINVKDLRNALVSGRIGGAVAAMIDAGRVVLHDTSSSVPVPNMPAGVQAVTMPDGTIHMVSDALTRENAQAVLLHEAFHNGGEKLIGSEAWGELLKRLSSIHRQAKQSSGRAREFYDAARRSVARAQRAGVQMGEDLTAEEFGAYTIEHYDQAPPAFRKWVDDVIGALKAWLLRRFGIQAGAVTPAQLRALAVAALRNEALAADASRFSVAPPTNSQAFRRWFGNSKIVDENGEPMVVYHGSPEEFTQFNIPYGGVYFAEDHSVSEAYAERGGLMYGAQPFYLRVENLFDATKPGAREVLDRIEEEYDNGTDYTDPDDGEYMPLADWVTSGYLFKLGRDVQNEVMESLRAEGYDGVRYVDASPMTGDSISIVVFDPTQIKSAKNNVGTYDPNNPDIRYSLKPSKHFKDLTDKQKSFLDKIGPERLPQRLSDRWRQLTDNLALRIRQAGVDRYAALLRNDQALYGEDTLEGSIASSAWVLARMSHAAGGALAAMIDHGRIYLDPKEKVIDVREGTTGLRQMFQQLGSPQEIDRFMAWVAANRARKLMAEGRENLFTKEEIDAGINLSAGRMEDGRNRGMVYAKAWKEFQQFRDDVLAIAEQSGTISPEQRALWSQEFYVPFYRVLDDDSIGGPSASSGLSRQQAYKRLKGGKQNLNDLLENTLLNFHHLIQSALKNQAARQAVENAETLGIAHPTTESKRNKKASTFVMVDGQKQWYDIEDPLTFKALSALNTTGLNTPLMKVGRAFKRLFTNMTTITPQFMIANTLRDSLSAMATSPTSAVPLKNAIKGAAVYGNDRNRARMLASGASFSFGHVYGQTADEIKASLRGTLRKARVISDPKLVPGALLGAWRKWNQITDFAENVNRAGIWERNQGRGKLKAAFEARDLMDFSAHGDSLTVRIMIDLVPFLNARIQGLDKLYRSGFKPGGKVLFGKGTKADKAAFGRFAAVVGALSLVSMMLYLNNKDDEEYRKLEDWQRDTYWFFRFGENAFFIPKPFEVGAIATLAERALEQFMDPTVAGKKFADRLGHMLTDTFALDLPQIIKPAYELATNRNTFTDRPIEDMGMQRLSPSLRVKPGTSKLAEGMSRAMESVAGDAALSPLQIDHLIGAYLGQVGAGTVALADVFWRRAMGEELPARRWSEYQPIRRFYRDLGAPAPYTRYSTDFYEALKEADKAYANVQHLLKYQEFERADKLTEKEADKLEMRRWLNKVQRDLSKINAEMRRIQMDKEMSGEEKRYQLDRLRELRNMITEEVGKELEQDRVRRRGQQ